MDPRVVRLASRLGNRERPLNFIVTDNLFVKAKQHIEILQRNVRDLNDSYLYVLSIILARGNVATRSSDIEELLQARSKKLKQLLEAKQALVIIRDRLIQMEVTVHRLKYTLSKA